MKKFIVNILVVLALQAGFVGQSFAMQVDGKQANTGKAHNFQNSFLYKSVCQGHKVHLFEGVLKDQTNDGAKKFSKNRTDTLNMVYTFAAWGPCMDEFLTYNSKDQKQARTDKKAMLREFIRHFDAQLKIPNKTALNEFITDEQIRTLLGIARGKLKAFPGKKPEKKAPVQVDRKPGLIGDLNRLIEENKRLRKLHAFAIRCCGCCYNHVDIKYVIPEQIGQIEQEIAKLTKENKHLRSELDKMKQECCHGTCHYDCWTWITLCWNDMFGKCCACKCHNTAAVAPETNVPMEQ